MLFGKTILVTGASSGIGARTAELAAQLGADVIGLDLRPPAVPMSSFVETDLSAPEGIAAVAERLPKRIDALCNVAGVSGTLGAAKTIGVNFYGLRAFSEAMAPRLRDGGAIVNVASIAGYGWRANIERRQGQRLRKVRRQSRHQRVHGPALGDHRRAAALSVLRRDHAMCTSSGTLPPQDSTPAAG